MFQVSLGSNSGEDHPGTHPTVNPWLDTMEVDSISRYPISTTNTNTLNPPVQMEANDQHSQYHPWDDSGNNPDRINSTAAKNPAEEWVKSKVWLQEVNYSQCLREELQQTKVSLTQVLRQNEELAVCLLKSQKSFSWCWENLGIDQEPARHSSPTISKYGGLPTECWTVHGEPGA